METWKLCCGTGLKGVMEVEAEKESRIEANCRILYGYAGRAVVTYLSTHAY